MASFRLCSVENCAKRHYARGWCWAHYLRWRRHDDPLAGVTPNGEPERFFRETVLTYQGDECLPWPFARAPRATDRSGSTVASIPSIVLCARLPAARRRRASTRPRILVATVTSAA